MCVVSRYTHKLSTAIGVITMTNLHREEFHKKCFEREEDQCIVPWCTQKPDEAHHIIERDLWDDGGYILENGVSICNHHHQYAESNDIPPQAFWFWLGISDPPLPDAVDTWQINKWGRNFDTPAHEELREWIKYPSSTHMLPLYWAEEDTLASNRFENEDKGIESLDDFVGVPLVITEKMDGGNMLLVNDIDNPVRARNGSHPEDTMKKMYDEMYWEHNVHEKLPDRLQVFGEWLWAKHSIHYGCECDEQCEDVGPALTSYIDTEEYAPEDAYFQVFGVYDTTQNIWLSWPEVEQVADTLEFPTVPVLYQEDNMDEATFETTFEAREELLEYAHTVVDNGGEGIVFRTKFPYHYGQFTQRLGKYVRENHVTKDEKHWSHRTVKENQV